MTTQEQFAYPGTDPAVAGATSATGWWESRTLPELEEFIDRGIEGGDTFFAAVAEIERRERSAEAGRRARAAESARTFRRQRIALLAGGFVLVLGALAIALEGR